MTISHYHSEARPTGWSTCLTNVSEELHTNPAKFRFHSVAPFQAQNRSSEQFINIKQENQKLFERDTRIRNFVLPSECCQKIYRSLPSIIPTWWLCNIPRWERQWR